MQNDNKIDVPLLVWKVSITEFQLNYFEWIFQNQSGYFNNVLNMQLIMSFTLLGY